VSRISDLNSFDCLVYFINVTVYMMRDASWFKEGKDVVPCREHIVLFYLNSFFIFHTCWK